MLKQTKVNMFQISGDVFRALGLKIKIAITVIFSGLLIGSVILLTTSTFSNNFNDQLLDATLNGSSESETLHDKFIGGLLKPGFDEGSCVSRYTQSLLYRKPSPYKPSPYLVSKLRSYEKLHKRCGPGTKAYKKATKNLGHDDENYASKSVGKCRYIVWVAVYGLGNRILTLASVFLYALLTNRVVLVDQSKDISDLFCEPFPGTSWLLPRDFPLMKQIDGYNKEYSRCYGTMLNNHAISANSTPRHLYLHILHDSRDEDKMFFCTKDQDMIDKVPWLIVKANVYFVPSLWFNPTFQTELMKLFPQKEAVFHHLARYLYHPTNQVWGMITRYHDAHLARADDRLGIQIRVFSDKAGYFQHVMDQILSCTQREKLLPKVVSQEESKLNMSESQKLKAVLVTSLYPEYADRLKNMFWEQPSSTGELIEVYQPSGERYQQTDNKLHDQKALAEMYLLSLTDNIVTSARSTFGYVAHSLGGLKPWLLYQPRDASAPDPPCVRSTSIDPCHLTPPSHGCDADWGTDSGKVVPFVKHCEDRDNDDFGSFSNASRFEDIVVKHIQFRASSCDGHNMRAHSHLLHPKLRFNMKKLEDNILFKISGMMKLTITFATCLVLSMVLLLPSYNISNLNKSHLTTTGGLFATGFDEESCLSRYHQSSLRKPSPFKPSTNLVSKLRSYEMLHKRCGPGSDAYKRATKQLGNNNLINSNGGDCQYVVWTPMFGLGNRILSMVSVFTYALITDRVMLVDQRNDITDLFCEPFPGTSWLLPSDFPLTDQIDSFNRTHSHCYGTMLKNHTVNSTRTPSHLYIDIFHDSRDHDKMFFCEENQSFIKNIPWLVVKSNLYYAPSLWLIPSFQTKLIKLFPQKDTVFHHLSHYLFHPTNQVWGMVTRSYNAYLSRADEVLGLQIRVFSTPAGYFQHVMDQIVSCTQREKLLPELATKGSQNITKTPRLKAVLVTSLHPEYSDELKNMFLERPSSTGELIEVYQPSGERVQQTDKKLHDQKALAEIYLLSLTDKLVTSTRSTFGYVAQGLGGLKPWILYEPRHKKAPDPPCVRAMSMEPCSLKAPISACQAETIKTTPFVKYCEDRITGIKLVDEL
ncbi:unnamed protein product [Brassica oleracea]